MEERNNTKETLTNEALRKRYKNPFDLVRHAINIAENMIYTGREPRVKMDSQNRAQQIIAEISAGKDYLDDIVEEDHAKNEESSNRYSTASFDSKNSEERKSRRFTDSL